MRTPEEQLVDASLDMGKALLLAGGEVTRVEDTITRILHAYGMHKVGVFTITSLIEVTARTPDGDEIVKARRIAGGYATNLDRVEQLNALSREICATCPSAAGHHFPYRGHQVPEAGGGVDQLHRRDAGGGKLHCLLRRQTGRCPGDDHPRLFHQLDGSERHLQKGEPAAVLSGLFHRDGLSGLYPRPGGHRCPSGQNSHRMHHADHSRHPHYLRDAGYAAGREHHRSVPVCGIPAHCGQHCGGFLLATVLAEGVL